MALKFSSEEEDVSGLQNAVPNALIITHLGQNDKGSGHDGEHNVDAKQPPQENEVRSNSRAEMTLNHKRSPATKRIVVIIVNGCVTLAQGIVYTTEPQP